MKAIYKNVSRSALVAAEARFRRRVLSKRKRAERRTFKVINKPVSTKHSGNFRIVAPARIDLYNAQWAEKTLQLLEEIESLAHSRSERFFKITICFRNTSIITAAAALLLLARVETLLSANRYLKIGVVIPPKHKATNKPKTIGGPSENTVDSVLNRIGFYEAIGIGKRRLREAPNVRCWEVMRGTDVVSQDAGALLKAIQTSVGCKMNKLFRPLIEAMANAVEHAYDIRCFNGRLPNSRWWMFASFEGAQLTVLICDLGAGIPNTLKITQGQDWLNMIKSRLGISFSHDCEYIKAAMEVKKSRTELSYRGKGGCDLRSAVNEFSQSHLLLISNRGYYRYKRCPTARNPNAQSEQIYDVIRSIGGTLVEWTVRLDREEK